MTTKTTYSALSRSGEVVTRTTTAHYTHAVDNGRTIISFHQSWGAADNKARSTYGEKVVTVTEVERKISVPRQANTTVPRKALRFFEDRLLPGETLGELRVTQHFIPAEGPWTLRQEASVLTVAFVKAMANCGATALAVTDGNRTADFTVNELT